MTSWVIINNNNLSSYFKQETKETENRPFLLKTATHIISQCLREKKKKGGKLIRACREGKTIPAQSEPVMDYPLLGKGSVMAFGIGLQVTPRAAFNKATLFTPFLKVRAVRLYWIKQMCLLYLPLPSALRLFCCCMIKSQAMEVNLFFQKLFHFNLPFLPLHSKKVLISTKDLIHFLKLGK